MGVVFFFQAEDGIRDADVTGVQTCALPISVRALDPRQPVHSVVTMEELRSRSLDVDRLATLLLGGLAAVAVVLAAAGVFGVLAHAVARRTREIGTRMALGADRADVLRLVLGDSLRLAVVGATFGLA